MPPRDASVRCRLATRAEEPRTHPTPARAVRLVLGRRGRRRARALDLVQRVQEAGALEGAVGVRAREVVGPLLREPQAQGRARSLAATLRRCVFFSLRLESSTVGAFARFARAAGPPLPPRRLALPIVCVCVFSAVGRVPFCA